MAEDPWRVLGIPPKSSENDIRLAYRQVLRISFLLYFLSDFLKINRELAKKWHPDRHKPSERELAEVLSQNNDSNYSEYLV